RFGFLADSLDFAVEGRNVLLTTHSGYRLTPIFKRNTREQYRGGDLLWTGSPDFHRGGSSYRNLPGNAWHNHFLPGYTAAFGPNWVNVSVYDVKANKATELFERPVLIQTLYYPAYEPDTLNGTPVLRTHYLVSAYDEDTNGDKIISDRDLRRLYAFDLTGGQAQRLLPADLYVLSCTYDPTNDYLYVYARRDENGNGQMEIEESRVTYWIDLNDPRERELVYAEE
ncbi:MAG: hypothetical protein AAFN92_05395, partial [Bacteroidota bacterium]